MAGIAGWLLRGAGTGSTVQGWALRDSQVRCRTRFREHPSFVRCHGPPGQEAPELSTEQVPVKRSLAKSSSAVPSRRQNWHLSASQESSLDEVVIFSRGVALDIPVIYPLSKLLGCPTLYPAGGGGGRGAAVSPGRAGLFISPGLFCCVSWKRWRWFNQWDETFGCVDGTVIEDLRLEETHQDVRR